MNIKSITLAITTLFLSTNSLADLVTWNLLDITFDDGGTANGSFVYDADLDIFSDISIITTTTGSYTGSSYEFEAFGRSTSLVATTSAGPDLLGEMGLSLIFEDPLTNLGGTISINQSISFNGEGVCGQSDCGGITTNTIRYITGGYVTTSAVPVPAAVWLFGSGLISLIGVARRKKA